jgi:hypothetical protein
LAKGTIIIPFRARRQAEKGLAQRIVLDIFAALYTAKTGDTIRRVSPMPCETIAASVIVVREEHLQ